MEQQTNSSGSAELLPAADIKMRYSLFWLMLLPVFSALFFLVLRFVLLASYFNARGTATGEEGRRSLVIVAGASAAQGFLLFLSGVAWWAARRIRGSPLFAGWMFSAPPAVFFCSLLLLVPFRSVFHLCAVLGTYASIFLFLFCSLIFILDMIIGTETGAKRLWRFWVPLLPAGQALVLLALLYVDPGPVYALRNLLRFP